MWKSLDAAYITILNIMWEKWRFKSFGQQTRFFHTKATLTSTDVNNANVCLLKMSCFSGYIGLINFACYVTKQA